jgi:hypothetical protein
MAEEEHIKFPTERPRPTTGSVSAATQLPGMATMVSSMAIATGGIKPGGMIETDR